MKTKRNHIKVSKVFVFSTRYFKHNPVLTLQNASVGSQAPVTQ